MKELPLAEQSKVPEGPEKKPSKSEGASPVSGAEVQPRSTRESRSADSRPADSRPADSRTAGTGGGAGRGAPFGGRGGYGGREGRSRDRDRGGRGPREEEDENRLEERVVKINRCATVVKGGRRFSFSALVVIGDRAGNVGIGFGKANEVPPSVDKAVKDAKKSMVKVSLKGSSIPHQTWGSYRTSRVTLVPAVEGTGVIAGAAVRAVVECVGIKDVLTKVYGSTNPINVVKATLDALKQLRTVEEVARLRGVEVAQ